MIILIKKLTEHKKCVIKRILKFNNYKNSLANNEIILKTQQRFKVKHIMYILKKLTRS